MYTVTRGKNVLGKILGRRSLDDTKAAARAKYGAGVAVTRIL